MQIDLRISSLKGETFFFKNGKTLILDQSEDYIGKDDITNFNIITLQLFTTFFH